MLPPNFGKQVDHRPTQAPKFGWGGAAPGSDPAVWKHPRELWRAGRPQPDSGAKVRVGWRRGPGWVWTRDGPAIIGGAVSEGLGTGPQAPGLRLRFEVGGSRRRTQHR